jgi:hypothetical protein
VYTLSPRFAQDVPGVRVICCFGLLARGSGLCDVCRGEGRHLEMRVECGDTPLGLCGGASVVRVESAGAL